MKLLALDTSTDACSVALMVDEDVVCDHRVASQKHAELVLPMIDALMARAQIRPAELDALVYGRGPGSFTGVRIGVGVAQGIALGADIGVVGISTLQSIAQGCLREYDDRDMHVCVDARMKEVYYGHFRFDDQWGMQPTTAEIICSPDELSINIEISEAGGDGDSAPGMCWAGSGIEIYEKQLLSQHKRRSFDIRQHCLPNSIDLIALAKPSVISGTLQAAENAMPVYLRNNVARTTQQRELDRAATKQIKI